jgi:predicted nucleic acid-binding Zn ribbon protein
MPNYFYTCPECNHKYNEMREADQSAFFTRCNDCGNADYVEVTE